MALDPTRNFASCVVSMGYDAVATTIVLASGEGAKLPDPATEGAFNITWFNWSDFKDPADDPNVERVRVTARTTDTITILRAQEGTTATPKNIAGKIYRMTLSWGRINAEQMRNHPLTTKGDIPVFGTAKTRLPVGTDGQTLLADSVQSLGVRWGTPPVGITSGWELIRTETFTGNINITGLDGNADQLYWLIFSTESPSSTNPALRFNSDVGANYHRLFHRGVCISGVWTHDLTSAIAQTSIPFQPHDIGKWIVSCLIQPIGGIPRVILATWNGFSNTSHWGRNDIHGVWTNTADNITIINIIVDSAINGRYWLFRRRA